MKKVLIIITVLVVSLRGYTQTSEAVYLWTLNNETMTISKSDDIGLVSIAVPEGATDSCHVDGSGKVVNGIATNGLVLGPGGAITLYHRSGRRIKHLQIIADDGSNAMILMTEVE